MFVISPMSTDEIRGLSAFMLCRDALAECGRPDDVASSGARFLTHVRDETLDLIATFVEQDHFKYGEENEWHEAVTEMIDGLIPVYTYDRWQTFIDLEAYHEEVDLGGYSDLNDVAAAALEQIAVRLATNIYDSVQRWKEQEEQENDN